jgi:hypothetical protein
MVVKEANMHMKVITLKLQIDRGNYVLHNLVDVRACMHVY